MRRFLTSMLLLGLTSVLIGGCQRLVQAEGEGRATTAEAKQSGSAGKAKQPAATPGGADPVPDERPVSAWLDMMKGKDTKGRQHAASALARIGEPAVPALANALKDTDVSVRVQAAQILGRIGPKAKAAVPRLLDALKDREVTARIDAALALGRVSPDHAKDAVAVLARIVRDLDSPHRLIAAQALGEIGTGMKLAADAVTDLVIFSEGAEREPAAAVLKKIDPDRVKDALNRAQQRDDALANIFGEKPPVVKPELPKKGDPSLVSWEEIVRAIGEDAERGKRDGQRFVLLSKRLLIIEGTNALDVFFPASKDGLLAGLAFLSGRPFTAAEQRQLTDLLKSRSDGEKVVGRFKARLGASPDGSSTLPAYWIKVELEPSDPGAAPVAHAIKLAGNYSADELLTESKFKRVNKLVAAQFDFFLPPKELSLKIRTLNNLADAAGCSAADTLMALERAMEHTSSQGQPASTGISAAEKSFAFLAATNKDALLAWRKRGGPARTVDDTVRGAKPDQDAAIAAIKKLGGVVRFDDDDPKKPWSVTLQGKDLSDADLANLAALSPLKTLLLKGATFSDKGLQPLESLPELEWLELLGTPITDEGLKHVAGLTKLKYLSLGLTKVSDNGLRHAKKLTHLEHLNLAGTKVTDEGLVHLQGLTKLKALNLNGAKVTLAGVGKLERALPQVEIAVLPSNP